MSESLSDVSPRTFEVIAKDAQSTVQGTVVCHRHSWHGIFTDSRHPDDPYVLSAAHPDDDASPWAWVYALAAVAS